MTDRKKVDIKLALAKDMEDSISDLQKEYIEEDLQKLDPVKENNINIDTTYIFDNGDHYEASIMIRNGLNKNINFDKIVFCIIDKNNVILTKQLFDMKDVEDLPSFSARPYKLNFDKSNMLISKLPKEGCKVVFFNDIEVERYIKFKYENLPHNISSNYSRLLNDYLSKLDRLREGEFSISVYDLNYDKDNKNFNIIIIIRNGASKKIKIDKIPMSILDENNNKVLSTVFKTDELQINPSKAGIYNFVFSANGFSEKTLNLNKLHVEFA